MTSAGAGGGGGSAGSVAGVSGGGGGVGGGHLLLQHLVALHHRGNDFIRHAEIAEVNDFVRIQIERAGGIGDVATESRFHPRRPASA